LADYGIIPFALALGDTLLKGNFADFSLQDIFWLLSRCSKTGRLTVAVESLPNHIYFNDGMIYAVESSFSRDGLGSRLVRAKKLTEEDLDRALDYCAENTESLESVLVRWQLVTRDDLDFVVRKQIKEIIFFLFHVEGSEFVFDAGLQVLAPRVLCDVDDLLRWCVEATGAMVPVLRPARTPGLEAGVDDAVAFTPDEWATVSLINGRRSIADLADALGLDHSAVIRDLRRFLAAGLVALLDGPELEDGQPALGPNSDSHPHVMGRRNRHTTNWRPPLPPPVIDLTDQSPVHPELSETP
jgi:DNA-binding transcriptional ArsR family regulator